MKVTVTRTESQKVVLSYSNSSPNGAKRTGAMYKTNNIIRNAANMASIEQEFMSFSAKICRAENQRNSRKEKRNKKLN